MSVVRRRVAGGAMALGVALGLGLLGWMRPGDLGAPAPSVRAPVQRELKVRRSAERRARPPLAQRAAPVEPIPDEVPVEEADPTSGLVVIDVVDEDGRPAEDATVLAVDCPGFRAGPPGEYRVDVGPCTLRAVRRDGALLARGPEVTVEVGGPDPAYAQLELTGRRFGGIGIRFNPVGAGMEVVQVAPGTPAAKAGLEPGDVVVAVGDDDVAGMDAQSFIEAMTGPEGTDVEFTIGWTTDTGTSVETLRLTRAFLEG